MNSFREVVDLIMEAGWEGQELHLTGSHFFGGTHQFSDWDFFMEYSDNTVRLLSELSYRKITSVDRYDDSLTIEIYEKNGVQVQLVNHLKVKLAAQLVIHDMGLLEGKTKMEAREIWKAVISAILRSGVR